MKPLLQRFGEQMRKCYILARTLILFNTQHAILRHTRITHDRVGYFKKKKKTNSPIYNMYALLWDRHFELTKARMTKMSEF